MKRFLIGLTALLLLLSFAACSWTPDIVGEDWVLEHVLATDEAGKTYVAYASAEFLAANGDKYPNAEEIAFTLRAKGGKIEIKNTATGETFLGTYADGDEANPEQTLFALKFGKRTGTAVAELLYDADTKVEEHLLAVNLAGYAMVFVAK